MKKYFLILFFQVTSTLAFAQAGMWTWVNGDSVPNSPGVYGVQGVPSPLNHPPALYEPCEWTDLQGNFWLFGGFGPNGVYNDLWKYNPLTNEWTWVKGSGIPNSNNYYFGVKGIQNIINQPPEKGWGVATWIDLVGDFWMFGGMGITNGDDLWKYSIATNSWTWIFGDSIGSISPNYGTMGVSSPLNTPGWRDEVNSCWTDTLNDLWLFGGFNPSGGYMNDLWKFNQNLNEWTWMKGSNLFNQSGNYGQLGIANSSNLPRARSSYNHWVDPFGNFWLFGGCLWSKCIQ